MGSWSTTHSQEALRLRPLKAAQSTKTVKKAGEKSRFTVIPGEPKTLLASQAKKEKPSLVLVVTFEDPGGSVRVKGTNEGRKEEADKELERDTASRLRPVGVKAEFLPVQTHLLVVEYYYSIDKYTQ
ncbi:hypothetical protein Q8A73_007608 [Channa argus]|nr:hypothetical protein Q8A73_007608 [Channa argus]